MTTDTPRPERVTLTGEEREALACVATGHEPTLCDCCDDYLDHDDRFCESARETFAAVEHILAARDEALREEVEAELLGELNSEDANAVLYGVTGTHPETYSGVTKDEALDRAGELLTRLRALAARIARGETR